ncbi:MarR family transcriptional regulator [Candidatus Sumerlaeota bacterium]|nr:MarR family transcriptional regulator [Candidatus Sumerlaeota bacterium]
MGSRWGINRTVAQVHALLYLSERPLHAEEICETLSIARSNVSISLKELQSWGVVRTTHVLGDRRDHFECMQNIWEMFRAIANERKKREVEPTLAVLRECAQQAKKDRDSKYEAQRLQEMLGFFELLMEWHDHLQRLPTTALTRFARLAGSISKWLPPQHENHETPPPDSTAELEFDSAASEKTVKDESDEDLSLL